MNKNFCRTELLVGEKNLKKFEKLTVAVFGLGGVGGYVVESLARLGVGNFLLFDADSFEESNLNRQILATIDSLNQKKVDVAKSRILSINENANVQIFDQFVLPQTLPTDELANCDYILDCIDTISTKVALAKFAQEKQISIVSAMGTGNKTDASKLKICDIFETKYCPLAKTMRNLLKKANVQKLTCVYSQEPAHLENEEFDQDNPQKRITASMPFVPAVCGLLMANYVALDVMSKD